MSGAPMNEQLRAARQASSLSVSQVARLASTSRSAIYAYESGQVSPSLETAERILACCGHELAVRPVPGGRPR